MWYDASELMRRKRAREVEPEELGLSLIVQGSGKEPAHTHTHLHTAIDIHPHRESECMSGHTLVSHGSVVRVGRDKNRLQCRCNWI